MNRLPPGNHYSDHVGSTDAVVGVSADQTKVVEDWSDDLFPRASTSSLRSEGGCGYHSYKKGSRTGSVNTSYGSSSGFGSWTSRVLVRQRGEYSRPGSMDNVKRNSTSTVGDNSRGDSLVTERGFSSGDGEWAEEEDVEGVVIERKGEVKGSGDDVELTTPLETVIGT